MPIFDAASVNAAVAEHLNGVDMEGKKNVAMIMPALGIDGKFHITGVVAFKVGEAVTLKGFYDVDEDKRSVGGFMLEAKW